MTNIDIERLKHDREYWDEVAPEGAEYYSAESNSWHEAWYKKVGMNWLCFTVNIHQEWIAANVMPKLSNLIPRPAPAWDGNGLPPVGVECEFRKKGGQISDETPVEWQHCKVIAITRAYVILRHIGYGFSDNHECSHHLSDIEFRPIRTDRERVVEAALEKLKDCGLWQCSKEDLQQLYDAGFLRMPEGEPTNEN
jgi:hypothetical protein